MVLIRCGSCRRYNSLTTKEYHSRRVDCQYCGANLYATKEVERKVRPRKKRRSPYRRAWEKKRG